MKSCIPHWEELKAEVKAKGLYHYVSKDGQELTGRLMEAQGGGKPTIENFDPLMGAYMAITAQFIHDRGLSALIGDLCPLCEVEKSAPGRARNWIEGSVGEQAATALKYLGIKKPDAH